MNKIKSDTNTFSISRLFHAVQKSIFKSRHRRLARQKRENVLQLSGLENRFTEIYKQNYWSDDESVSGPGSTLSYTANLRKELPRLFTAFNIQSLFDAPCGDFGWMKYVLKEHPTKYYGGDIVAPLVQSLNEKYKDSSVEFLQIDLTKDLFPQVDLMICRDCLFHLSFADTKLVFQNFVNSNIKYLLTTTHIVNSDFKNKDITSADFREIDLFSAPYNMPKDVIFRITDWVPPFQPREMCLWSRDQVIESLKKFDNF
ncbi:hypothetical protein K2X05_03710 [bacterium]|nr:hypothetical protein [bacterium]